MSLPLLISAAYHWSWWHYVDESEVSSEQTCKSKSISLFFRPEAWFQVQSEEEGDELDVQLSRRSFFKLMENNFKDKKNLSFCHGEVSKHIL